MSGSRGPSQVRRAPIWSGMSARGLECSGDRSRTRTAATAGTAGLRGAVSRPHGPLRPSRAADGTRGRPTTPTRTSSRGWNADSTRLRLTAGDATRTERTQAARRETAALAFPRDLTALVGRPRQTGRDPATFVARPTAG